MANPPPTIFAKQRKRARRLRAASMMAKGETARFLLEDMAQDVCERLAFLRHEAEAILVEGFDAGAFAQSPWPDSAQLESTDFTDFDEPLPQQSGSYDLVISANSLDTVNDLPGALIQMRALLRPGGLAMAVFIGGQSLPKLRRAMHDAEADRPAARMHPLIDPRSCPQLLGRAGWKDPVVDSYRLTVRYSSLDRLLRDLRAQAMGAVLAKPAPPMTRRALDLARAAFLAQADDDGKVSETFEIITLTGRR